MKKKWLLLLVTSFLFTSCNKEPNYGQNVSNNYESCVPYINVEKSENEDIVNITPKEYMTKMENKETFILLFYSPSCYACNIAKKEYVLPYIKETKNTIYGIDVYDESNYADLANLITYQPVDSTYFHYDDNNKLVVTRPTLQINKDGEVLVYEKGTSKNLVYMLQGYIL